MFHRRSLSLAFMALLVSASAASFALGYAPRTSGSTQATALRIIIFSIVAIVLCTHATFNLACNIQPGARRRARLLAPTLPNRRCDPLLLLCTGMRGAVGLGLGRCSLKH